MAYYYLRVRFSQTDSENVLVDAIDKSEALHIVSNYYTLNKYLYTIDDVVKIDKIVKR